MLQTHVLQHVWANTTSQHTVCRCHLPPPSHRHLKAQRPPPHAPAVLIVVSADVAEVSSKGLHSQRAGDFPTPPFDDDTCGGHVGRSGFFQALKHFPVFLAAQFLGVAWSGELHQHHPSGALAERGKDAEGSKCKDICHQGGTGPVTPTGNSKKHRTLPG